MKQGFIISIIMASGFACQVIAGTMGETIPNNKDWTWISAVSVGAAWADSGETQTFFLAPEILKTYAARKSTNVLGFGELFIGIQKSLFSQWSGQLGLAAATTGNAKLQGIIWDDASPEFANYSYHYKIQHTSVAMKGKLLLNNGYWLMPWLGASVGVGFNQSHDFSNIPLIFPAIQNTNFTDHTKTSFTYTLSAGVQKTINEHWQAGLGYEFADWGKSVLGRAIDQTLNSGLALNHLYTNAILLNLTYIV